jgi:hypothetical protein
MMEKSGLIVNVVRDADGSDCSNHGISSRHTRMLLILPEGGPFKPRDDMPTIKLVATGPYYYVIEDDEHVSAHGSSRCCFGGNFVWDSDSRFPKQGQNKFPIPIHDRVE